VLISIHSGFSIQNNLKIILTFLQNANQRSATEVPIKDLVDEKESSQTCNLASVKRLHHHALRALFSIYIARDPYFQIPDYAIQFFETTFSYKQEAEFIPIKDNDSLMKAIQYGSEQHMFDDNDNIILHCYCVIRNTYISDVDKQLNQVIASSTRAVDKTMQHLRILMTKLRKTSQRYDSEPSEGISRHFVDRILHYIFHPNAVQHHSMSVTTQANYRNPPSHSKASAQSKSASTLVGKLSTAAGRIATFFHRLNPTIVDDNYSVSADSISPSVFEKINKSCSYTSSKDSNDESCSSELKLPESPVAIEIVFDCEEDQRTPAEWNLFFKVSGHDTRISLSDSSSSSKDGGILVDDEDVISLDASSVSNDFDMLDAESIQNNIQDFDESYSNPSYPYHVVMNMDIITCPSDEERSMDGVMVQADADVSCVEKSSSSSVESWTESL